MFAVASLLMLAIGAAGLVLAVRGFKGRRVGDRPVCQYCHAELDQRFADETADWSWENCPACTRNLRNAVAIGVHRFRYRSLVIGIVMLVSSVGLVDRVRTLEQSGHTAWAFVPDWLLVRAASPTRGNPQHELIKRAKADTLSENAWGTLLVRAKDRLGASIYDENHKRTRFYEQMQRRGMLFGQCYALALMHGRATQDDWEWYARRVSAPRLLAYARYDGSKEIRCAVWTPFEAGLSTEGIGWEVEYETLTLEGEWGRIEAYDSRLIEADGPQWANRGFELRGRAELPADASFDAVLNVCVVHANPTYPPVEYQTHLRRETTLLPQGEPLYDWVTGPEVDRTIAESLRIAFSEGQLPGRPIRFEATWVEPFTVSFSADLIMVVDGVEQRIGDCRWDYVEGLSGSPSIWFEHDPRPVYPRGEYSLLLRASGEPRGLTRPYTDRLWIGEIDLGVFPR